MESSEHTPSRLVDYFVVVGFDDERERNGESNGKILQRFPAVDWPDVKFYPSLEVFCQPDGWCVKTERSAPQFFITVLTDLSAGRAYAAVLAFDEPRANSECGVELEDEMDESNSAISSTFYQSKCLVLVSKHAYFEAFRMCLGTIYSIHLEKMSFELENIVGCLLGGVMVPPPGAGLFKFSLGAGDRLAVHPPLSVSVPCTQSSVAMLFQQLGMYNVVCLFCAVMTERKILLQSQSYRRMTEASQALSALMFPLKYRHVYVPLLPAALQDFLHSPMPYIMGMHSSTKVSTSELPDVIVADLDTGCLDTSVPIPPLPEPFHSQLMQSLSLVLNKHLFCADLAFPPSAFNSPTDAVSPSVDKAIRACFIRLIGDLLSEYRVCLQLVRLHPTPVIEFHRAAFLGLRGLQDDPFMNELVQSNNAFEGFIHERGPPFRLCDVFDEVYASLGNTREEEKRGLQVTRDNIQNLAQQLTFNECGTSQPFTPKFPHPTDLALACAKPANFPMLDQIKVRQAMENCMSKMNNQVNGTSSPAPREVPCPQVSTTFYNPAILGPNVRRLDVLRTCLRYIFDDKISDARKMLSAVVLSMKSQSVRVALCQELFLLSKEKKSLLEPQQFDLVVRLMNHALQNESANDEHGVAYAMLHLSNTYHRRLSHAVLQFAYTCIQEHAVWMNAKFWESAFFHDVQQHLKMSLSQVESPTSPTPYGTGVLKDTWNLHQQPNAMKLACQKMRASSHMSKEERDEACREEDEIIRADLGHYAYYMVNMRVPLDATKLRHVNVANLEDSAGITNNTPSVDDEYRSETSSERSDTESGFAEDSNSAMGAGGRDLGMGIVYWVDKIMDTLSHKANLPESKTRQVKQKVPGLVAMQIEQLEHVYKESKRLPPINKPKMLVPSFLPGEQMLQGYLRVYLMPDGRHDANKMIERTQGSCLLPAEGALFLTNYRIIFKGTPCDPFICDQVVVKSVPVMSITRSKQLGHQTLLQTGVEQTSHFLRDALQIRTCTFQLLKIAFDEEVSGEKVETLVTAIDDLRHPSAISELFALSGGGPSAIVAANMAKDKHKGATLRGFAKKTLKTAKLRAGFTPSVTKKISKSNIQTNQSASESDDESNTLRIDELPASGSPRSHSLSRTLDRLGDREYCKDYHRLSLCLHTELTILPPTSSIKSSPHNFKLRKNSEPKFRLCTLNKLYALCASYPAVFIVPYKVTDDSLWKIAKGHKHQRFPVVTWMSEGGAMLIRGSAFYVKSMVGRLKKQAGGLKAASGLTAAPTASMVNLTALKSSVEQEKYLETLVSLSPSQPSPSNIRRSSVGSLLSLNSLMMTSLDGQSLGGYSQHTPDSYKRPLTGNTASALGNFMRSSGGKGNRPLMMPTKSGTLRPSSSPGSSSLSLVSSNQRKRMSVSDQLIRAKDIQGPQTLTRANLYILGDKSQTKVLKLDSRCEFIPVEYPTAHDAKGALKKLLRVTSPATIATPDAPSSHLKALEETGWMHIVQSVMHISSAVVDIVDIQNSSVAFCFEEGWDATCQLTSLSQILLDPYYRTFEGLRTLVEKEWLGFGHRFSHRLNHLAESTNSGIAPMFILFLDALHQILSQYPTAFEYNDYLLRLVAYHSTSAYFNTFIMDCEGDRVEAGVIQFHVRPRRRPELTQNIQEPLGSMWNYIDEKRHKSTMLSNTLYLPNAHGVLRPNFNLATLDLWEYYTEDHMAHGASYDIECAEAELLERLSNHSSIKDANLIQSTRKVVDLNYSDRVFTQHSNMHNLIEEIGGLERDLDQLPRPWQSVLQACRLDKRDSETAEHQHQPHWNRWLGRALHKKTTVELLLHGVRTSQTRMSIRGQQVGEGLPHSFQKHTFSAPEQCQVCHRMLWGVVLSSNGLRCSSCKFNCHEKCSVVAPNSCSRHEKLDESEDSKEQMHREDTFHESLTEYRPVTENRTHEGYLMKRGALLKSWKQRWFVLDSIKHQLRYYDTMEDGNCRGLIDLAEVSDVQSVAVPPGLPRRQDGTFFDLRTLRRVYNFSAASENEAREWIEKIESCLRES